MDMREPSARYLAGVQRSELGALPADWRVVSLDEFKPFVTSGSRGWAAYYSDVGSTFLRITNLSRARIYPSLNDLRYVAVPADNGEGIRTALKADDLLISITADIGIVGLVTADIDLPAYINQHIALVRFTDQGVNSRYLAYFLAGASSQRRFKSMTDAGAKAGMNLAGVRAILAALPPTAGEQRAIADALTDADALIDSLEQLLTKKRQIKQGAMQELLTGKRRLPGFNQPWMNQPFGTVVGASRERVNPSAMSSPPRCLELEHLQSGTGRLTGSGFESQQVAVKSVFRPGDVLFGKLRAYLRKYWLAEFDGVCSTEIWVLRPRGELTSSKYLFYAVQRDDFIEAASTAYGTHMPRSDWKIVAEFDMRFPQDSAEQEAIAQVLSDIDADIAALEARLTKARALKQAMAQALLTGRIRLVPPHATQPGGQSLPNRNTP